MNAKRPVDVAWSKTVGAVLDLPFRAANLIWEDVPLLTPEELEYLSEPVEEIFGELGLNWLKYVKAEYLTFAWGLSVAVASRVRGVVLIKAAERKAKREGAVE